MILKETVVEIADAIREKKGTTDLIAPMNFAEEIKGIAVGGGGVPIVASVDELSLDSPLGSLACVVEPGSIKESSFRDLYQPDASMIDENTGTLTAPELLSSVSSVRVFSPEDVTSIEFEPVESMVYLVSRDFSMTSQNMAMVQIMQQGVMAITMTGGYDTMQQLVLAEFSQDTMSYTIHNDQVEAFNAVLANGMDWCYFGDPQAAITEEQFDTIDLFVKAVAGTPSKAHVYLKKDEWEELYTKDLEKIVSNMGKIEEVVTAKADKKPVESYNSGSGVKPNVYTTLTTSGSTGSVVIKLADITDASTYNEYLMEITCTYTPSSVVFKDSNNTEVAIKWANGIPPTFDSGITHLISIVNGFGVYSVFPNS